MITEGIIIAIIGGGVTLLGIIIKTYKCNYKSKIFLKPLHLLDKKYYSFDNPFKYNEYVKRKNGKYEIIEKGKYKIINTKNKKYKIKVPPGLKLTPNGSGAVNVYKEFKQYSIQKNVYLDNGRSWSHKHL